MLLSVLLGMVFGVAQAPLVPPLPRLPLPRPAANAIRASTHSNHEPAGSRASGTLTIALGWYIPLPVIVVPAGTPR